MQENQQKTNQLQQIKIQSITFILKNSEDATAAFNVMNDLKPYSVLKYLVVNDYELNISVKHATRLNNTPSEKEVTTRKGKNLMLYNLFYQVNDKNYLITLYAKKPVHTEDLALNELVDDLKLNESVEINDYTLKVVDIKYFKPVNYITCFLNESRENS